LFKVSKLVSYILAGINTGLKRWRWF